MHVHSTTVHLCLLDNCFGLLVFVRPLICLFYTQTFREGSRFKRIDNHLGWFALMVSA